MTLQQWKCMLLVPYGLLDIINIQAHLFLYINALVGEEMVLSLLPIF